MNNKKDAAPAPGEKSIKLGETLTLVEAAAYLKLGIGSTRSLFAAGELPGLSLNQKHVVFLKSDLANYVHDGAVKQSAQRLAAGCALQRCHAIAPKLKRRQPPDLAPYELMAGITVPPTTRKDVVLGDPESNSSSPVNRKLETL